MTRQKAAASKYFVRGSRRRHLTTFWLLTRTGCTCFWNVAAAVNTQNNNKKNPFIAFIESCLWAMATLFAKGPPLRVFMDGRWAGSIIIFSKPWPISIHSGAQSTFMKSIHYERGMLPLRFFTFPLHLWSCRCQKWVKKREEVGWRLCASVARSLVFDRWAVGSGLFFSFFLWSIGSAMAAFAWQE